MVTWRPGNGPNMCLKRQSVMIWGWHPPPKKMVWLGSFFSEKWLRRSTGTKYVSKASGEVVGSSWAQIFWNYDAKYEVLATEAGQYGKCCQWHFALVPWTDFPGAVWDLGLDMGPTNPATCNMAIHGYLVIFSRSSCSFFSRQNKLRFFRGMTWFLGWADVVMLAFRCIKSENGNKAIEVGVAWRQQVGEFHVRCNAYCSREAVFYFYFLKSIIDICLDFICFFLHFSHMYIPDYTSQTWKGQKIPTLGKRTTGVGRVVTGKTLRPLTDPFCKTQSRQT